MRQAIAILLLFSLSVHCTGQLGIAVSWWLNQDYIARVLCINRDKPQLKCNGKCHLRKQLKVVAEHEKKQQPGSKQVVQDVNLFCATVVPLRLTPPTHFPATPHYGAYRVESYAWDRPGPDHPPAEG
ncbi:hypothetical protein HNQ93_000030 [Hymenobacter luteus]|uniref:Uncharacterized protein n=2 Tax=Hymenobacter TaxID=89966 RepID=A0A7W9WAC9_9BACT|nr:hypothetical protein [Hymenobacter latericoloratus]MBB4600490.1 hypothetical protein [Hymenobacter latericoloratus]MBB6057200.1 hypothetical protein [Hymenobacter luteus]